MKILITNDDGINSPGIEALVKALYQKHEVVVSAPAKQQSAKSQAISVGVPLYVENYKPLEAKYGIRAIGVSGTPADSVKLYFDVIAEYCPDIAISGINDGANLGTDLLYSGTVGAAKEALMHGVPAIAISLDYEAEQSFDLVASELVKKLDVLYKLNDVPRLININFPKKLSKDFKWVWARQGKRDYEDTFEKEIDASGKEYYVMRGKIIDEGNVDDTDVFQCNSGNVTITPISLSIDDKAFIEHLVGKSL